MSQGSLFAWQSSDVTQWFYAGDGLDKVMLAVEEVYEEWNKRIGTGELNRWFAKVKARSFGSTRIEKVKYITQVERDPFAARSRTQLSSCFFIFALNRGFLHGTTVGFGDGAASMGFAGEAEAAEFQRICDWDKGSPRLHGEIHQQLSQGRLWNACGSHTCCLPHEYSWPQPAA